MSLDLEFDAGQEAIAAAVAGFCADRCDDERVKGFGGTFPGDLWRELAELGVLGVASDAGDGGALELVAAVEALGHAAFPGPLAGTFLAMQVLDGTERTAIAEGERIVSAGTPPLLPFAPCADVFLEIVGERVFRARPAGAVEPVEMLGGEPWGRVTLVREQELSNGPRGLLVSELAVAAQLSALGHRLVEDAVTHASDRQQFGTPIGDFQAVAHPLADCAIALASSSALVHAAAFHFDREDGESDVLDRARLHVAIARISAGRTAVEAAHVCHQVFGAVGITLEGPVFHLSRRILQLASQPPGTTAARTLLLAEAGVTGGAAA